MFSTMMTVASTMMPRSIAPTDSRLADSPRSTVMITARNSATGMVAATISAQRRSPRNTHWIRKISAMPNSMLCSTVLHRDRDQVAAVVERLDVHAGRQAAVGIDALRPPRARRCTTSMVRSNFCISTMPVTMSVVSSRPAMPSRGVKPICTLATSDSSTGTPPCWVSTMLPMSSSEPTHADAAHVDRLLADRDGAAADIGVAGRDRADDLRQRQAVGHHAVEVDLGLEFLGLAAEHQHVGDARHDAQLALDHPVLQRLELHDVHAGRPAQLVAEDLADGAGGRDHRLHAGRQRRRPSAG